MSPEALHDRIETRELLPAIKRPAGVKAWEDFVAKRKLSARKSQKISRIIGLTALVATPVGIYLYGNAPWTYFPPLLIGALFADAKPDLLMDKAEYQAFPGSQTESGRHLCIHCGAHEVEVHHLGRTGTIVRVYCANCETLLYRD